MRKKIFPVTLRSAPLSLLKNTKSNNSQTDLSQLNLTDFANTLENNKYTDIKLETLKNEKFIWHSREVKLKLYDLMKSTYQRREA